VLFHLLHPSVFFPLHLFFFEMLNAMTEYKRLIQISVFVMLT
jgi:hypothetical protein